MFPGLLAARPVERRAEELAIVGLYGDERRKIESGKRRKEHVNEKKSVRRCLRTASVATVRIGTAEVRVGTHRTKDVVQGLFGATNAEADETGRSEPVEIAPMTGTVMMTDKGVGIETAGVEAIEIGMMIMAVMTVDGMPVEKAAEIGTGPNEGGTMIDARIGAVVEMMTVPGRRHALGPVMMAPGVACVADAVA